MKKLFTERQGGGKPRVSETLEEASRVGLLALVSGRLDGEWFGYEFPDRCPDGYAYAGTDHARLSDSMKGYGVLMPNTLDPRDADSDGRIFDLLEFTYQVIAEPSDPSFHSYFSHSHYSYDRPAGREKFTNDVNRILELNGIAFELRDGEVVRIAGVIHEALTTARFDTGDGPLNELLEASRQKFLDRSPEVRRDSLEKLWDAWERLKTVESGKDKKAQTKTLLDKAASDAMRERLDVEALELTDIGNTFMIRHAETDKVPITDPAHVDYLFHRMFSLIGLLLKKSGRGG